MVGVPVSAVFCTTSRNSLCIFWVLVVPRSAFGVTGVPIYVATGHRSHVRMAASGRPCLTLHSVMSTRWRPCRFGFAALAASIGRPSSMFGPRHAVARFSGSSERPPVGSPRRWDRSSELRPLRCDVAACVCLRPGSSRLVGHDV